MPSLTSELTLDSPSSSRYHASPEGLFQRRVAYSSSVLQSPTLKSPESRFLDSTDGRPIDLNHLLDRQSLDVKYLKLELESLSREKGQLERDNLHLRKRAEALELHTLQAIEAARRDERARLLDEMHSHRTEDNHWGSVSVAPHGSPAPTNLSPDDSSAGFPRKGGSLPPRLSVKSSSTTRGTPAARTGKPLLRGVSRAASEAPPIPAPLLDAAIKQNTAGERNSEIGQTYAQIPRIKVAPQVLKRRPIPSFVPSPTDDERRLPPRLSATLMEGNLRETTDRDNAIITNYAPDPRYQRDPGVTSPSYRQPTSRRPLELIASSAIHGIIEMLDYDCPTQPHIQRGEGLPPPSHLLSQHTAPSTGNENLPSSHTKSLRTTLGIALPLLNKGSPDAPPANARLPTSEANRTHHSANSPDAHVNALLHRPDISPSISTRAVTGGSQLSVQYPGSGSEIKDNFASRSSTISPLLHRSSLNDGASIYSPLTLRNRPNPPRDRSDLIFAPAHGPVGGTNDDVEPMDRKQEAMTGPRSRPNRNMAESGNRSLGPQRSNRYMSGVAPESRKENVPDRSNDSGSGLYKVAEGESRARREGESVHLSSGNDTAVVPRRTTHLTSRASLGHASSRRPHSHAPSSFQPHKRHSMSAATRTPPVPKYFDARTYSKQPLQASQAQNQNQGYRYLSSPPVPELRPSDSISHFDAYLETSHTQTRPQLQTHADDPDEDEGENTDHDSSAFSMDSEFLGVHLPDLPPLPDTTPSPQSPVISSSLHSRTSKSNNQGQSQSQRRTSLGPGPARAQRLSLFDATGSQGDGSKWEPALAQRALAHTSVKVGIGAGLPGRGGTRSAVEMLRKSWSMQPAFEEGFDPTAQRVLSSTEYQRLVDDIVLFDRDLISSQLLLARAENIFIAPERANTSDVLRGERVEAFRYLASLILEHETDVRYGAGQAQP